MRTLRSAPGLLLCLDLSLCITILTLLPGRREVLALSIETQEDGSSFSSCSAGSAACLRRSDFPKNFVVGAGTSSYQVEGGANEGGRGESIWDVWTHRPGSTYDGANGDVSVDEYHRYEEDVELLASINMDAYRFSISWSRIFPDGRGPETNKEGIAYYNRLIDSLLSKGIEPYVTLFHWDLPLALEESYGGFLDRQIVLDFANYAEACFAAFGDRVKTWMTFNEPSLFAISAYVDGTAPPARTSHTGTEPYIAVHHILLAHASAVAIYRKHFQAEQGGVIGIVEVAQFMFPLTNSSEDRNAAERSLQFQMSWTLDPVVFGGYPAVMRQYVGNRLPRFSADESAMIRGSADIIGVNHYTSRWASRGPGNLPNQEGGPVHDEDVLRQAEREGISIGPQAGSSWLYIVPEGIHGLIKWVSERYNLPIVICENGMDYLPQPKEESLKDAMRVNFHQGYMSAVARAIREGADVRGYFVWSLLDSLEFVAGFQRLFGLFFVDHDDDLKRWPRDSALWFKQFLQPTQSDHDCCSKYHCSQ